MPAPSRVNHVMTYDYDAIVVGGRVAGASTGMLLARRGHKVLILERAEMPSDTISTHAVMRTGVLQLRRWGLLDRIIDAGTPPVRNITLGFGDGRIRFEVKPDFGVDTFYAPRRYLLDSALLSAAEDAGADIRDRSPVTDLVRGPDGRVEGVNVGHHGGGVRITSRFVIGADGHRSRVADRAGSRIYRSHPPLNAVHYGYFDGVDSEGFWFQFTAGVNAGLIQTNDGQHLVFAGRPTEQREQFSKDPDAEFLRLLEQAGPDLAATVSNATRVGKFRGTNGLEGFIRQAWGPGWVLVGDAGHTTDPISAHGISDALRDAELCARAIDAVLAGEAESDALGWYEELRDSLSNRIYEQSEALARFEWSPEEASARMRVISDEIRAESETLLTLPAWPKTPSLTRA